jgi:pyruvate dehydrogenase E1 component
VTSFSELAREAREFERWNRLHPLDVRRVSHVETCLKGAEPIVAASDYVRACPQMISSYVSGRFVALGTDGFGRSDTRAALRSFFEIDRLSIVLSALHALALDGELPQATVAEAIDRYGVVADEAAPWSR